MSVSIITAVWGTNYNPYIPRWWESIRNLKTKPNEIVLVSDTNSELHKTIPDWLDVPVVKIETHCDYFKEWWATAIESSTEDWIVGLAIDDQFHPEALDFVSNVEGDLVIDDCIFLQGGEWLGQWEPTQTHDRRFAPAALSPFNRRIAHLYLEMPKDIYHDDYLFYLLAAKENVKVYKTSSYRLIHDLGDDHQTLSGKNADQEKVAFANAQIARLRQELGL
jgi:hypothetical protein